MVIETLAILSPGDMGHAVGQLLREHELKVVTCLTGRSQRTKYLAELAGIADVPDLDDMVAQSQIILSISVSEMVPSICQQVADAIKATNTNVLFAECNAVAPQLSRRMEQSSPRREAGTSTPPSWVVRPRTGQAPGSTLREIIPPSLKDWPTLGWTLGLLVLRWVRLPASRCATPL